MKFRASFAIRRVPFLLGMLLPALHADTIGLHFCEDAATQVGDDIADGFDIWTDSWPTFTSTGTNFSLRGATTVQASWNSATMWRAGAVATNEQALYRTYLDDGSTGGDLGVRVTINGLARWLALTETASYQIRCYANNDSSITFLPISIRDGGVTGTVLHTMTVAPLGDGNYPPGSPPVSGASRGYVDSIDTLTAGTVSLTLPPRSGATRGTLAAFKITGIGEGPPVDHFEAGDGEPQVVNVALAAGQTSVFRAGLDSPAITGTFSAAATHVVDVIPPASGFAVQRYTLLTCPEDATLDAGSFQLLDLPRGVTGSLVADTTGDNPVLALDVTEVTPPDFLYWNGNVSAAWDVKGTGNWLYQSASSEFWQGDKVVFDDNAAGNFDVTLDAAVLPAEVTVDNTGHAYAITGSGSIGGNASLFKSGTNALTLGTANSYSGTTNVNVGKLVLANNGALGSTTANTIVADGAVVDLNGHDTGLEGFSLAGSGPAGAGALVNDAETAATASGGIVLGASVTIGGTGDLTLAGVISGSGSNLTKVGPGNITSTATNNFTGTMTVAEGTWTCSGGHNLGNCSGIVIGENAKIDWTGDNNLVGGAPPASKTLTIRQGGELTTTNKSCHLPAVILDGGMISADTANTAWANYNFDHPVSTPGNGSTSYVTGGNVTVSRIGGTDFTIGEGDTLIISSKIDGDTGAADTGLIKEGPGNLVLIAANTHDSPTTINGGTLTLAGSLRATSAVTVASGATLAGTGTAHGSVDVQAGAILAPGDLTTDPPTATATLTAGSAIMTGTFQWQLDGSASDALVVTGALDLTGGTIALSTLAAPTAPSYVIASAASITGTPEITGDVPEGYSVQSTATQIRLVSDTAGFAGWIGGFGLAAEEQDLDDDPDGDGIDNGIEYVLGGNPATGMDVELPKASRNGDNFVFTFDRAVASETADVALDFEHGTDLTGWTPISVETANPPQVTITRSEDGLTDHIVVTIPAATPQLFGRLTVTAP